MAQIKNDHLAEGYHTVDALTMKDIYYNKINQNELKRIHKLEWIDEFEEFDLIMSHYFISIAKKMKNEQSQVANIEFSNLNNEHAE